MVIEFIDADGKASPPMAVQLDATPRIGETVRFHHPDGGVSAWSVVDVAWTVYMPGLGGRRDATARTEIVVRRRTDGACRTRVEIDPNVRVGRQRTRTGLEDCHGPIAIGDDVTVYESEAGIEGHGRITDIDYDKKLVWLWVNWASLRPKGEGA